MAHRYLTIEHAIATHALTIEKSGGGTLGVLEIDKLASVLDHIQMTTITQPLKRS